MRLDDSAVALALVSAGTFVVLAGFTAPVGTISVITGHLHGGSIARTWILSGVSVGLAAALMPAGALADLYGRREIFVVSTASLALTMLVEALAPSAGVLIAGRVAAGLASAGVVAAGLGLLGAMFPAGDPRTRATAVWGAMVGAGIAAGASGGALLTAPLGWRAQFYVLALLTAIVWVLSAKLPRQAAVGHTRAFDWNGSLAILIGSGALTAALALSHAGQPVLVAALSGVAAMMFVAFWWIEQNRHSPLLDPRLLRRPLFVASISGALTTGLGMIASMTYLPVVLERGYGTGSLLSTITVSAWALVSVFVAFQARQIPVRHGSARRLAVGMILCATGTFVLAQLPLGRGWPVLVLGLLIAGCGSGVANAALGRLAVESVDPSQAAMGSGANNTARYLGGAAGIALMATMMAVGQHPRHSAVINGWHHVALVASLLCLAGGALALACDRAHAFEAAS